MVHYGTSPDNLTWSVEQTEAVSEHRIRLNGLAPGTRYYYAYGSGERSFAGGDADHHFVTAPLPGTRDPFRVWIIGDSGTGDDNARAVRDAYAAFAAGHRTDVWLMLGDNAYVNGTDVEYQTALFDVYTELLRTTAVWPTLGNHDALSSFSDTQSGPYFEMFDRDVDLIECHDTAIDRLRSVNVYMQGRVIVVVCTLKRDMRVAVGISRRCREMTLCVPRLNAPARVLRAPGHAQELKRRRCVSFHEQHPDAIFGCLKFD